MLPYDPERPIIGLTMGDAAGIGPEIVLKAVADSETRAAHRCVIIGDAAHLRTMAHDLGINVMLRPYERHFEDDGSVEVIDLANLPDPVPVGIDNAVTGKASAEYIGAAVKLWRDGDIDAVSTAPISKKAIALGGFDYPGHTEMLADLTGSEDFAMSFFSGKLRVVLLSTHLPLLEAIDLVTTERLVDLIAFTDRTMGPLLGKKISIAVAGLNPHASEGGMFGSQETVDIEPAIRRCRDEMGVDVRGPFSPDTIFLRGYIGEFDCCIALYHDQATIAVKSLSFGGGVNVTLGLPIIRTSVDHGTAYDKAGQGVADPSSMIAAIKLAGELVKSSQKTSRF